MRAQRSKLKVKVTVRSKVKVTLRSQVKVTLRSQAFLMIVGIGGQSLSNISQMLQVGGDGHTDIQPDMASILI